MQPWHVVNTEFYQLTFHTSRRYDQIKTNLPYSLLLLLLLPSMQLSKTPLKIEACIVASFWDAIWTHGVTFFWEGILIWLVVSTHLKNISQIGSFPQIGVKIKNL